MTRATALAFLASLAFFALGCGTVTIVTSDGIEAKVRFAGKGCAVVEKTAEGSALIVEQDGISNPLAGTIRSVFSIIGSVFGGARGEDEPIKAGEGCAGVLVGGENGSEVPATDSG